MILQISTSDFGLQTLDFGLRTLVFRLYDTTQQSVLNAVYSVIHSPKFDDPKSKVHHCVKSKSPKSDVRRMWAPFCLVLIEYRSGHEIFCAAFTCAQQGAVKSRDITRAQSSKKIRGGSITIAPHDTNREQKKTVYGTKD